MGAVIGGRAVVLNDCKLKANPFEYVLTIRVCVTLEEQFCDHPSGSHLEDHSPDPVYAPIHTIDAVITDAKIIGVLATNLHDRNQEGPTIIMVTVLHVEPLQLASIRPMDPDLLGHAPWRIGARMVYYFH